MSNDVIRWVIGLAVLAHGIGHALFMPALNSLMRLDTSGRSWLLSPVVGDGATQALATVVAGAIGIAFVAAGAGILLQTGWWRQVAIIASVASIALVVLLWDGIPTSSAFFAFVFDAVVLAALIVAHWPSPETIGA
jgi:hypothetical protein